jgi:hypothetical protein
MPMYLFPIREEWICIYLIVYIPWHRCMDAAEAMPAYKSPSFKVDLFCGVPLTFFVWEDEFRCAYIERLECKQSPITFQAPGGKNHTKGRHPWQQPLRVSSSGGRIVSC